MNILITVKCVDCQGGVAQIYKMLQLHKKENIDYFFSTPTTKNKFFKLLSFPFKYLQFFRKIKTYDIIHINPSLDKTAIWRDMLFLILAKFRKKKVIVFMHGWEDYYEDKIKKSRFLSKLFSFYNKADAFFILGDVFKEKLISLGINTLFFKETTIADNRYIEDFSIEQKIINFRNKNRIIKFLFISRIAKGKGMFLAIDIFNAIQQKNIRNVELIFAGTGKQLEETKQYVKDKNISNVKFVGYIKDKEKHILFKKSHFMLFPTMFGEGLPNSILEGMLYGMPIISRVNAGITDWVKNNENGFITKSIKAEDFLHFIEIILKDKNLYQKMALNNHQIAKENFVKEVIVKRYLKYYQTVYTK